ncbi:hypothetical protein EOD41_18855 [Mucilaginibacter limnophilus]|uniref:Uncharacterized protein n=1 Tax=Mucilaginibacter limnophilus TaxID=1932778 RepID=A0A3S2V621_9SPHI|nr:TonB-dependent receptor plug domain-containing protein [Mucilaginibacter limnophilus]RVT97357.1 hypothetical protein EOD41_18855 [Mucilaginibacter limnophilus]
MFVIDGVPFVNSMAGNVVLTGLDTISALSFINSKDIESIDLLKDADATVIMAAVVRMA